MMKKFFAAVLALAMMISCAAAFPAMAENLEYALASGETIAVIGDNLVKNGSFELDLGDVSLDPNPDGWTMWGMSEANVGKAATAAADGEKALHLILSDGTDAEYATVKQEVALEAGKSYVFTVYLESPHMVTNSVNLAVFDDNGRLFSFTREKDANGNLEFQQVDATFEVPSDAVNPKITISAGVEESENQKYMDNVIIYEIADLEGVEIEEKVSDSGNGLVTVTLGAETEELELKLYGDNTTPTSRYDNRSKYIEDILYNVNRDFGGPSTDNTTRTAIPIDVYDKESFEAAVNIVKENPKSNPILSTDYIDAYYEQLVALRPGYINYLEQMVEAGRMDITVVPVSNPWWQYMRLEEGQTEYTEEQWQYFYKNLWGDTWRHGFARGYIYAKYFGQTNYNMGNEPDNWENGQQKFVDWELYAYECMSLADGWRTGVQAAGYDVEDAQLWGPTLAGWNTGAWDTIAEYGSTAIDVYDYHTYGGGTAAHKSRIQNFKARIEKYDAEPETKKVSNSEFNWKLSGDSFDWLDKMPGCISHIQIMRTQALEGLYASIRFSFGEMFFKDTATSRYLIPERMYYAIRQFNRTLTNGNVIVTFETEDAASGQDFFATKSDSTYFVHFINDIDTDEVSSVTIDLKNVEVRDGANVILREMSEDVNDEVVLETVVENSAVTFENLKGGAMYLAEIAYGDYEAPQAVVHRAFGYADSIEVWWENEAEYTAFNVYRSVDGGEYELIAKDVYNAYYEDYDVEEGKEYSYKIQVRVYDKLGEESEVAGPIILKSTESLPYMGDFEGGTLAGFEVVGDFEVEEYQYVLNAVGTAENEGDVSALILGGEEWKDYTVNTTVNPRDIESGSFGKVGMYARYVDENNYYLCALDSVERTVSITKVKDGVETLLGSVEIPEAFKINSSKSLPMTLTLVGDSITFYAEMTAYEPPVGQRSASVTVTDSDFPTGKTAVFVADGAQMSFSSVKVVEVFSDLFQGSKSDDWQELSGTWSIGNIADGSVGNWWYTQSDASGDDWKMSLTTSGAILDGYVAAKVMTDGTAAIIAKYQDDDNFMRYQVQDGVLSVIARVAGEETTIAEAEIPEQAHDYYTIVVDFDRNHETIAVGGNHLMSYEYYIPELSLGKFGVATKGSTASFDHFLVSATSVDFEMPYFADCDGHWAEDDIKSMAQWGYIQGMFDGNFYPEDTVTRAEFVAMGVRMLGADAETELTGEITDLESWYAGYVQWAYNNSIIPEEMIENGKFNPESEITREEMVAIVINIWKYAKPRTEFEAAELSDFTDGDDVSDWAKEAMGYAVNKGIIEGFSKESKTDDEFIVTELKPKDSATRAQAAVVLNKLYKSIW